MIRTLAAAAVACAGLWLLHRAWWLFTELFIASYSGVEYDPVPPSGHVQRSLVEAAACTVGGVALLGGAIWIGLWSSHGNAPH